MFCCDTHHAHLLLFILSEVNEATRQRFYQQQHFYLPPPCHVYTCNWSTFIWGTIHYFRDSPVFPSLALNSTYQFKLSLYSSTFVRSSPWGYLDCEEIYSRLLPRLLWSCLVWPLPVFDHTTAFWSDLYCLLNDSITHGSLTQTYPNSLEIKLSPTPNFLIWSWSP